MIVKLLTEHYLEFLSLKGVCRGSSESTLVKMTNCWKSHALALNNNIMRPLSIDRYLESIHSVSPRQLKLVPLQRT